MNEHAKFPSQCRLPSRQQSPWRLPLTVAGSALALIFLCSCESVTYDLRPIQQPVVLNDNPFLAPTNTSPLKLANVDTYTATVSVSDVTASYGNGYATTTVSTHTAANQAQVNAFNKIGGQTNRLIRNMSLDTDYLAINGLFALAEKVSINAVGDIAEIQFPAPLPAPSETVTNPPPPAATTNTSKEANP